MIAEMNERQQIVNIPAAAENELARASEEPDLATRFEEQSYELACANTKLAKAHVRSLKQDIEERKTYARRIFGLICTWVVGLFLLLAAQGLGHWWWLKFSLSETVLLAAIGSTTINVLGLFYIVAHYLFPTRQDGVGELTELIKSALGQDR
jgi:hypothetical protein